MSPEISLSRELGYLRTGLAVPQLRVADVDYNIRSILNVVEQACEENIQVLAFPEMSITGYVLGDLVQQSALLNKARQGLQTLLAETSKIPMIVIVGMPVLAELKVYNCAVVMNSGKILGIIPKTYLPNYKEFYDERWFETGSKTRTASLNLAGQEALFGNDLLFKINGLESAILGIEICEDLWIPLAPHEYQALAGATILINLSASNEVLGKAEWRRTMVASESGRCLAAYCYTGCGIGESSNDMVFGGHAIIAENGTIYNESQRFSRESRLIYSDIDLDKLAFERRTVTSFQSASNNVKAFRVIESEVMDPPALKLHRNIDPHPFVPSDPAQRTARCREIFSMQVAALAEKLTGSGLEHVVLGVSGGLDSTLALLAAVKTMDFLNLPRTNVHAFTLPGFGTTRRTRNNATRLSQSLGVSFEEVSIVRTCTSYLKDLGHEGNTDVVFENAQARYRTGFLFNKANEYKAIMLGTGDLTEVALGWSTFAGDQVSHYHINVSVPKTLVRYLVRWVADEEMASSPAQKVLYDILATPISPELLPPKKGRIIQKSEDIIGPVELADFYLYPFIRFGIRPGKILFVASEVNKRGLFDRSYTLDELYQWLKSFITRFFNNQFKRTCMPEGPKVGTVSLSPRSDWRMPSDASPRLWLEDLEEMYRKLKD